MDRWRCPPWVPALVLALTVGQLAVATFVPGIEQFEGKAFGARLVAYPFMMLTVPALWWDDANHFMNWIPLCAGIGLIICRSVQPRWAVVLLVTELDTAYEDTLSDEALGTLGGFVAALFVAWRGYETTTLNSVDVERRARTLPE